MEPRIEQLEAFTVVGLVFPAKGGLAGIGPAYEFISDQWVPNSSYNEARCGAIEVYGPRFAPETNGEFEIRIAIEPKA